MVIRAAIELGRDVPRGMKCSGIHWEYWIGKWKLMSKEIRHVILRKFIPALENGNASVQVTPQRRRTRKSNRQRPTLSPQLPEPTDKTLQIRLEEMRMAGFSESTLTFLARKNEIVRIQRRERTPYGSIFHNILDDYYLRH